MAVKIRKILLVITGILFLIKCSGNGSNEEGDFYLFDKSKLGIEITDKDLGISFYPPKEWVLMPASLSKKIEAKTRGNNSPDNFIYQPIYVFYNNSASAILSLGKVISNDTTLSSNAKLNYYKSFLSSKYKDNQLSFGNFTKSKILFSQFKFHKENLVSIKILFQNSKWETIQLDYSIPEKYFDSAGDFIKSSIGSIKLF